MQQFELVLKNSKIKSYRMIALLVVFFNLAVYIFLLFSDSHFYNAAASLFLVSAYCLYRFYLAKKTKTKFFMDEFSFFILAGSWVALHNYFIAAGCIFMGVLYYLSLQKFQFVFDNNSVKKLNFPKTEYPWNKFANVLLRDNILTLDFNNNKLIQMEIEDEEKIDETQFNAFAQQQLIKFSHPEESVYLN